MATGLWKRNNIYWMDATVNGQRYREPLGTSNWKEARTLRNDRIAELKNGAPMKKNKAFASMTIADAVDTYIEDRRVAFQSALKTTGRNKPDRWQTTSKI